MKGLALLIFFCFVCTMGFAQKTKESNSEQAQPSLEEKKRIARERRKKNLQKSIEKINERERTRVPTVKTFKIWEKTEQYKNNQLGVAIHFSMTIDNADKLGINVTGQTAILVAVGKPNSSTILHSEPIIVIPKMNGTIGTYGGECFVPYRKIVYQKPTCEFQAMAAVVNTQSEEIGESNIVSFSVTLPSWWY